MEEEGVLIEILSWLPTKSLLRFKCVNKQWHSLISNPIFAKIQLRRSSHHFSYNNPNHKLIFPTKPFLQSIDFNNLGFRVTKRSVKQFPLDSISTSIIGSCNGLICLIDFDKCNFFIGNPTILEFRKLPRSLYHPSFTKLHGYGYDSSTDDYKLVMTYQFGVDKDDQANRREIVIIYSLRNNSWRKIPVSYYSEQYFNSGTYWKGSLHWLTTISTDDISSKKEQKITTFDFVNEEFVHGVIPLPIVDDGRNKFKGLVSVAESLFVYRYRLNDQTSWFEAWVMADRCGMVWTKLSISNITLPRSLGLYTYKLLWFATDGKVVLAMRNTNGDCCSCVYNPDSKKDAFEVHQISSKNRFMYCLNGKHYVESLISPFVLS